MSDFSLLALILLKVVSLLCTDLFQRVLPLYQDTEDEGTGWNVKPLTKAAGHLCPLQGELDIFVSLF